MYKPRIFKAATKAVAKEKLNSPAEHDDIKKNILEVKDYIQGEEFKALPAEQQEAIKSKAQELLDSYKEKIQAQATTAPTPQETEVGAGSVAPFPTLIL